MSREEARDWAEKWDYGDPSEYGWTFYKWTPRIQTQNDADLALVEKAIQNISNAIKDKRAPCWNCGLPSILLKSQDTAHPGNQGSWSRVSYHAHIHNPHLPDAIRVEKSEIDLANTKRDPEGFLTNRIFERIMSSFEFDSDEHVCGGPWTSGPDEPSEGGTNCPRCGKTGSGRGKVGNQWRFFHEKNRSCYLGIVEPRLKRNPLVTCPKCGEPGREHRGKDGRLRVRHATKLCYIREPNL